jgi:hypothetical protein
MDGSENWKFVRLLFAGRKARRAGFTEHRRGPLQNKNGNPVAQSIFSARMTSAFCNRMPVGQSALPRCNIQSVE